MDYTYIFVIFIDYQSKMPSNRNDHQMGPTPLPFPWLMTQEHKLINDDTDEKPNPMSFQKKIPCRPFTQVDFPSFTQLIAEEETSFKISDPYKPPANPMELKELAWRLVLLLPEKDVILKDLVGVLENTHVAMWNGEFKMKLKAPLVSQPFKNTFLSKCSSIQEESSSSESSSDESLETDETESVMSVDEEVHPILLQEHKSPDGEEADITNDLDISSSEDEAADKGSENVQEVVSVAEKFHSPELPLESQTQKRSRLDMPNIENFITVATQTDLTMEDIEKLMKKRVARESQPIAKEGVSGSDHQHVRRRKKSVVRVGLPRMKSSKKR